jgi:TolB-like protein/Flp pilus assembly protein TadD
VPAAIILEKLSSPKVSTNHSAGQSGSADDVRRQLDRISLSELFSRSPRMSRFLRFTVERSLEGHAEELKEYLLGVEVFDRKPDYDSRIDPIVRVEARRLRAKLRSYYDTEGRDDELIIEFPTGGYVPVFRLRGEAPPLEREEEQPRTTIAVLPFANLSPDSDNEYFSDGLTQELIHGLTKVAGLRVVAWHSAARMKGHQDDIFTIGERLKVGTVLTGSVRRSADHLRIAAQLVDTSNGYYLWSETYDRELRDLFAIQEEISCAIIKTLKVRLAGGRTTARPPQNLEAYSHYLRGRFYWNQRTLDGLRKSVQCYEQALALEPELAVCYAGVADSYTVMAEYGLVHPNEGMPKARSAAETALALDPLLAEAHTSLGLIRSAYDWKWTEGGNHYRRAMELNPGYATAHHWYAVDYLAMLGRNAEARAEIDAACQLDPLSPIILEGKGYLRLIAGEYDAAFALLREVAELEPGYAKGYAAMGRVRIQQGRYQEAIALLHKAREVGGDVPSVLAALGQTHALAGNRDQARTLVGEIRSLAERCYISATCHAIVHLGLGENDVALDWLERGCARRDLSLLSLKVHPLYDPLRNDPRFQCLVSAVFGDI